MFHVILFQPEIPPNTGNIIRLCANTGCQLHLIRPLGFALEDKKLVRAGLDYHEFATLRVHDSLAECLESLPHTRGTLLAKPADCGSGCEAAIPAPDASQRRVMASHPNPDNEVPHPAPSPQSSPACGRGGNRTLRELVATRRVFALTTKGSQAFHQVRFQPGDAFLFGPESRGLPAEVLTRFGDNRRVRLPMLPNSRSLNLSNTVAVTVFEAWRQCGFAGANQYAPLK